MIETLRRIATALCCLSLSACSTFGVDFSDWASAYGKAVEKSQNENLLINMVRAAHNQPLYFTTIPVVRGNGGVTSGVTLNASYAATGDYVPKMFNWLGGGIGQGAAAVNPGVSLAVNSGFSFDMASLDNAEFVTGLLTPIAPATVHYYVAQGIPRELLFHLFIDRIEISSKTQTTVYVNDPTQKSYPKFVETVTAFLDLGLTTESSVMSTPFGPQITAQAYTQKLPAMVQGAAAGLQLVPVPGASGTEYQFLRLMKTANFCFKRSPENEKILGPAAFCGQSGKPGANESQAQNQTFDYQGASLAFVVRSTRDIFNYLGNQIYTQLHAQGVGPLTLSTQEAKDYNYLNHGDQLLVIRRNAPERNDLIRVEYRGDSYSVPAGTEGHSALVFTIMSQVLTLSKAVNLIPASTPVLVR